MCSDDLYSTANFFARALHKDVFPEPGGPCSRTTQFQLMMLALTLWSENSIVVSIKLRSYIKKCTFI